MAGTIYQTGLSFCRGATEAHSFEEVASSLCKWGIVTQLCSRCEDACGRATNCVFPSDLAQHRLSRGGNMPVDVVPFEMFDSCEMV